MKKIILILLCSYPLLAQSDSSWVNFVYKADSNHTVSVAGSFNNWNSVSHKMYFNDSLWQLSIYLPDGYYYYKIIDNGDWIPDPSHDWRISDGGTSFNSIIKVGDPPTPQRERNPFSLNKSLLPEPFLESNPEWIELYYAAWEMMWNKIKRGTPENGFADKYIDEGFNELIYQWDTNFMAAFAVYSGIQFPAMESLNNFYFKQRKDGYIQRVYKENDGSLVQEPTDDEPMINPPLFAWMELRYYQLTGDKNRLEIILPALVKYFEWIDNNCRTEAGKGLYYYTQLGSGMDNTPRRDVGKGGWIDLSAQMALAAKCILEISYIVGDEKIEKFYEKKYNNIVSLINKLCWDDYTNFYRDFEEDGTLSTTTHIGSFWTLISEVCTAERFTEMRNHLIDENEFWRAHLVPTLSASDPDYDPKGHYWRGGVWAPTNYVVVKGLQEYGDYRLAHRIAHNHISNIADVYFNFTPDEEKIAFEERYDDGYQTIWECYSPEKPEPATRWDNTFYSRQDFVGWSGLGPIAMLIENIIGINMRADANIIVWHVMRDDKHGISNLKFGSQFVDLMSTPSEESLSIEVYASKTFELEVIWNESIYKRLINPGVNIFTVE
jgi:hypothetical protein